MTSSKIEILAYEPSELGMLCLRRRRPMSHPGLVVTEITLDHEFLMSSYVTDSERALATRGLEMHTGRELAVLVGGLGLGYTARQVLACERVARVEVVEFLPQVIGWLEQDLLPLSGELKADERLTVAQGDIYARLAAEAHRKWDLILIDVDHSPHEQLGDVNEAFYTAAGLSTAAEHLAPAGVLGVWSYAESSPFAGAMGEAFSDVSVHPVTYENDLIGETHTDWLFFARGGRAR